MSRTRKSPFLALERKIAADERGGIEHRWEYGRELLKFRAGRQRLPKGMLADLVAAAEQAGLNLSEQEIQRRMRFAEVYPTEAHRRHAVTLKGSWHGLVNAGFPAVTVDELVGPDDVLDAIAEPDPYEQLAIDIPGFKPVLRIKGRDVKLADASVADGRAYIAMCEEMHESFGRTIAQAKASFAVMLVGCGGDESASLVDAWRAGTDPS